MDGLARLAITGSGGLIGRRLVDSLGQDDVRIQRLVRDRASVEEADVFWSPLADEIDAAALEGVDAVVHLAGESIAGGRWNHARKLRILESRTRGTALLARTLAGLERPPRVLVSASAIGYYGDRGDVWLDEDAAPGEGFLADVCVAWEAATRPAVDAGIRVVTPRIGIVLAADGGALAQMLLPFRLGLGGKMGSGEQYMSWIHIDDVVGLLRHALVTEELAGPVNATAPRPVTNAEFTRVLGRALGRPAFMSIPGFAITGLLGEMGSRLLLDGARLSAKRAEASGYRFRYPDLEAALRADLA